MHANDRAGLERQCRYVLRGPVSNDSLSRLPNGLISVITRPKVIREILECVGLPADSPLVHPSKVHLQIDLAICGPKP